ncbi:MAG: RnfABCDGE type electron transport complex subunit D [Flavobacteriales bacterium]|nr:RnfABCDGE type electron transport complex subunit D [Flavobacteriales bacterium]
MRLIFDKILKDARHFQIAFLGAFLLFGIACLSWETQVFHYLAIIITCIVVQLIFESLTRKNYASWKSALISSLGLCILLKTSLLWVSVIAAFITIASKFLIKRNKKHVFNPANIGIVLTIILTDAAWISPGQWGSNVIFLFLMGVTGASIVWKVGRLDISLTYISVFLLLEFIRSILYKGWPMDYLTQLMTNGTFLLFSFFMITDPRTTPNAQLARIIWAVVLAIVTFVLTSWQQVHTAPIWALFGISFFTPLFDKLLPGQVFQWIRADAEMSIPVK